MGIGTTFASKGTFSRQGPKNIVGEQRIRNTEQGTGNRDQWNRNSEHDAGKCIFYLLRFW